MKTAFKLANVEFNIEGVDVKIGEISTSVEDYNLLEGLQVVKELPDVIRQINDVLKPSFSVPTDDPIKLAINQLAVALDCDPEQINIGNLPQAPQPIGFRN